MAYVFYESALAINVMYTIEDAKKRAVGFKLSVGMDVPAEFASKVQVRHTEVETGGDRSRFVLRHQGRVLSSTGSSGSSCAVGAFDQPVEATAG